MVATAPRISKAPAKTSGQRVPEVFMPKKTELPAVPAIAKAAANGDETTVVSSAVMSESLMGISSKEIEEVKNDPVIRNLVDVFSGNVVDVRRDIQETGNIEDTEDSEFTDE